MLSLRPQDFNALVFRAAQLAAEFLGDRPDYMSTEGVAEYLHWPTSRIDNLCSQGRIPYYKDGGRRIFIRQEIDAWVKGLEGVTVQEAWALAP
jgi:excisionase family DNA binding protein